MVTSSSDDIRSNKNKISKIEKIFFFFEISVEKGRWGEDLGSSDLDFPEKSSGSVEEMLYLGAQTELGTHFGYHST